MTLLNQLIAAEPTVRSKYDKALSEADKKLSKDALITGLTRTYAPKDAEGETRPPETTLVQLSAETVLKDLTHQLADLFDVTLTKDVANTSAKADVVVDGVTLIAGAPVTYLMTLEKRLVDIRTFVGRLPVLNPADRWTWSDQSGAYVSDPVGQSSTKKEPTRFTKAPATKEHPEQAEIIYVDKIVGEYTTTKFSGAMEQTRRNALVDRADKLLLAVKYAREKANSTQVEHQHVGAAMLSYLFS